MITPPLILLAPFIVFLEHNGYPLLTPETLLSYAGFVAIGGALGLAAGAGGRVARSLLIACLITIFIDVQLDVLNWWKAIAAFVASFTLWWLIGAKAARALSAAFAAVIVASLAIPTGVDGPEPPAQTSSAGAATATLSDLPVLVHIILDEHIGSEGIPPEIDDHDEVKRRLVSFYVSNGFRLFGNAFSEYFRTYLSLPHMMSLAYGSFDQDLIHEENGMSKIYENRYLRAIEKRGFRIHVYESTFIDFCADRELALVSCEIGNFLGLDLFAETSIPVTQKIRVILSLYAERSYLYNRLKRLDREWRDFFVAQGIDMPAMTWQRDGRGTFLAMNYLDRLRVELMTATPGDAYLAHVLLPHHPYVLDRDCNLRQVDDWLPRGSDTAPIGANNTPESRSRRYQGYLEQVKCVITRLEVIFDVMREAGIYDDAMIVVHGDHGSRIGLIDPTVETIDVVSDSNLRDAFSTLFAIKVPGIEPGYDLSTRSIQELMASWAASDFSSLADRDDHLGPGSVFLDDGRGGRVRHPLRWADGR